MAITEVFTHNQPLGNSDPAHTAYGPGELTASTPAMTPLMLDATSGKLTVWMVLMLARQWASWL